MKNASFSCRAAYLPEARPEIVSPEWFDWLKSIGYTGFYIENDPFAPRRSGNSSEFLTSYRLISLYDLAWGEYRHRLRDWIHRACSLAHARGMKVYLALWEPRLPAEAWGLVPANWHGRGGWDRESFNHISWCLGHAEARAAFQRMAREALAEFPDLDGLKMGTHDNDAHHCNDSCPRCRGLTRAQKVARLFQSLVEAAGARPAHFDYVLYTWWWSEEELDAVAPLFDGRRVTVLGRSSQGLTQYWEGRPLGKVFDLALGVRGIGEEFQKQARAAAARGWQIADMTGFGHTIEYFWQPYTPAPNRVAERIVGLRELGACGWFDYDCGGIYPGINTEIIREDALRPGKSARQLVDDTLGRLYGERELAAARRAYEQAEEALALRPISYESPDVPLLGGRNVMEMCIALPFDPGDVSGLDQFKRVALNTPASFFTANTTPTLLGMNRACAARWQETWEAFRGLRGQGEWAASILPWEKQVVRAHALVSGSAHRYCQMASNRLARAAGTIDAAEEARRLGVLLAEELTAAQEFAEMWRADRRLLMNSNGRLAEILQGSVPWVAINANDPFETKLAHTREMLARLKEDRLRDAVPRWSDGRAL